MQAHMTVHIALDDQVGTDTMSFIGHSFTPLQSEENGALAYIPGSHTYDDSYIASRGSVTCTRWSRNGMPLPITADDFGSMDSIRAVLTEDELVCYSVVW